jgi:hypothetical protein
LPWSRFALNQITNRQLCGVAGSITDAKVTSRVNSGRSTDLRWRKFEYENGRALNPRRSLHSWPNIDGYWPSENLVIAIGVGLLGFAMYLWQLTVPEFIQFYDSGVYLAAPIHFVSGVVPYKDFTFLEPPGIILLLSPLGFVSRIWGSHDAFIVGRVVSAFVTALNAGLLAYLVRHRGRIAMLIAGVGLALLPVASFVSSGIRLEPYCICFILIGSLSIFSREEKHENLTNRDFAIGGLFFGFAALIKLWALFPFVALVITLLPRYGGRVFRMVGASSAVFVSLCLPFFALAPVQFISQVFVEQLNRKAIPSDTVGIAHRLIFLTGLTSTSFAPTVAEAVFVFAVMTCLVAATFWRRVHRSHLDTFLVLAALVSVVAILIAPESYNYYGYFTAPFLVGVVGILFGRWSTVTRNLIVRIPVSRPLRRISSWLVTVSAAVLIFALVLYVTTFYTNYAWANGYWARNFDGITRLIPRGSCVVYDQASYGVYANRLISSKPGCPSVVDPSGMWMAWGYQLIAPARAFTAEWKSYFETAQYVVLSHPGAAGIPWNKNLSDWFNKNYQLISSSSYVHIYKHVAPA